MRFTLLWILLGLCTLNSTSQSFDDYLQMQCSHAVANTVDPRSDSFDVLHYHIKASFSNFAVSKSITGEARLLLVLKQPATKVRLDLLGLLVNAVKLNGTGATFQYLSPSLRVDIGNGQQGDTIELIISYSGQPKQDAQWGGFYFTADYAFNMGVGFASDPHGFGRVWFPCFDNFTDKAKYSFEITVDTPYRAYCNGLLQEEKSNANGTSTFIWQLDQEICTYLASVAIAEYEEVRFQVNGIPTMVTSLEADSANARSSFENLPACIQAYIQAYGVHRFDRIGFNLVPFNSGAMEHATNIAYPVYAVAGGSKDLERLFAHELAHHWWGDNTTCSSQEDMWLNEGWANYSEYLFAENVYGREKYLMLIKENHKNVLQYAHSNNRDGEPLPVSGIGHEHTYGMHVYQKGGDMVHTLRGIMGDDAFFRACADFQDSFKFQSVNTEDMMNFFNNYSRFDLAHFFEQWIQTKGFCHFYLFSALKSGNKYNVRIKQDQRFNNIVYEGIPYTLRAYNSDLGFMDTVLVLSGTDQVFEIQLPFMPVLWVLDPDEWISDAITENNLRLDTGSIGIHQLQDAFGLVEVHFIEGEEILRLENHWVRPDHYYMNIPKLALHTQRYWTYDGSWGSSFEADLYLEYNGLGSFYLDNELIHKTEDSLVLLYRPNAWSQWSIAENIEFDMGSKFDRRGIIKVINAAKGLYALAMYDQALLLGVDKVAVNITQFHPNPADTYVEVSFTEIRTAEFRLELTSPKGELINAFNFTNTREKHRIDVSELPTGLYYLILVENNYAYEPLKLIIH